MAAERGTRKLAAIMFTDIKSFSKKMAENEELAMELLRVHDDTLKATIEKHDGKIIKAIGDAFMVDFSSAVNAVKCAIESQEDFYKYNEGKTELEKIEVRIGIHLGDVITDGNDIFGDGVNIAARIEAVTEPSRICISQDVYSQIKNKMQVKSFHMGSIELKNIPEPVEVYEILIDSIPEFSKPSKTAEQMPSQKSAQKAKKREEKEAEKIEAAKKKAEEDRLRAESETQEKVQKIFEKAENLFTDGKLDESEKELNEIFKFVAFHAGAQTLQARVEEERQKKEEEERKSSVERRKIKQQVGELMEDGLKMLDERKFSEAKLKAEEVLAIDPENEDAAKLLGEVRQREKTEPSAEPAPVEPQVTPEAQQEEVSVEEPETEIPEEEGAEGVPSTRPVRRKAGLRPRKRRIPPSLKKLPFVVLAAAALYFLYPAIEKMLFPKDTSILILPFVAASGEDSVAVAAGITSMITEDLSSYTELVVVRGGGRNEQNAAATEVQKQIQTRYRLSGLVNSGMSKFSVRLRLSRSEDNSVAKEWIVEGDSFNLEEVRSTTVANVLEVMESETQPRSIVRFNANSFLATRYFAATLYSSSFNREDLERGIELFRAIISYDSTFSQAYGSLGRALVRKYRITGEYDKSLLSDAVDAALSARNVDENLPMSYEVLGSAYRAAGRYQLAKGALERALELQPGNSECLRQESMLALIEGAFDRAIEYASKAAKLDPNSPESQEMMGHAYYFSRQFSSAERSYDEAIRLSGNSYIVTTRYKIAVWGAGLSPEPVAQYCSRILTEDSTNYVVNYWVGRAYMLSGIWTEAKKYLERGAESLRTIVDVYPNDPLARGYLALYRARLGEPIKGVEEADKAIELSNESAISLYRKAQFYAIQPDKKAEALEWLTKAVQKEYILSEVMSPDFTFLSAEPGFASAISVRFQ